MAKNDNFDINNIDEYIDTLEKCYDNAGATIMEIKNVNHLMIPFLKNLIDENKCHIIREEWVSKYNSYVMYEYEPFCADGFMYNVTIKSVLPGMVEFVCNLYYNHISKIEMLTDCVECG